MMNLLLLVLGVLLVIGAFIEALWTALWVDGNSAPLTSRLTAGIWSLFRLVVNSQRHKVLSLAGPVILTMSVLSWILLLLFGWTLIFYTNPYSLLVKSANARLDFADAVWYCAYTMFTVGNGDFLPQGNL